MNLDPCWKQELLFHCRQLQLCLALLCADFLPFASMFHFAALFATVDVTWAGTAATVAIDVSCFGNGILHAASTWDMTRSLPRRRDTYVLAGNPRNLLNKLHSYVCVLASLHNPQGENRVNVSHPYCLNTSAWRKQSTCVERWSVSEGENRYLVSYTVAMQPLVSSVTLVSVRSCSDGYSCMHVCTHRHTHFPSWPLKLSHYRRAPVLRLLHTDYCPFFLFPFSKLSRRGSEAAGRVRQGLHVHLLGAGENIKTASGSYQDRGW